VAVRVGGGIFNMKKGDLWGGGRSRGSAFKCGDGVLGWSRGRGRNSRPGAVKMI